MVLDTNSLVSRLLLPNSVPARAVQKAVGEADILMSEATLSELAEVLSRKKFDAYVSVEDRQTFIRLLGRIVEMISEGHMVHACRDPRDNKFLEVAVNGEAKVIVSGDEDLLVLHPFRGIEIMTPKIYVEGKTDA